MGYHKPKGPPANGGQKVADRSQTVGDMPAKPGNPMNPTKPRSAGGARPPGPAPRSRGSSKNPKRIG